MKLINEAKRMQELAGIKPLNEIRIQRPPFFGIDSIVELPEGTGKVIFATDYDYPYMDEIDASIAEEGWESSTPKEKLVWYKVKTDEDVRWYEEEELKAYNS